MGGDGTLRVSAAPQDARTVTYTCEARNDAGVDQKTYSVSTIS